MTDRTGQQLGSYRLIRLLGEGGFAEVYLGEHIHLNTPAAIKLLHTQLTNEDVDHFRNEARTIARLMHPNIVRVFDFGVEGKTPYLVMDYAPNGTLRQRHPRGVPVPLPTIVTYVKQVADALQYAHEEKLIHRDIKPENMLIGRRGEVLLSDFGIALIAQSSRYQNTQDVVGTVAYMAPEQIQAHPRPASDQYSLGIIVYEWLTGDRPFHGTFTEIALKHTIVPPPPLRERIPNISLAVEQVVMTALEKDPHRRFGSMKAFANAFEQASLSEPSSFTAPTIVQSPPDALLQSASSGQQSFAIAPTPQSSMHLNTPGASLAHTSQPVPPTISQPPAIEPTVAASLSNSAPAPSQPFPWSAPYAPISQPIAKPKNRLPRRTLIDYLIPASTSRNVNLLRNALLIVGFAVLFTLGTHLYIIFHHFFSFFTFAVSFLYVMLLLTGSILGKWRGGIAVLVYLAAGAIGLPVFSRLSIVSPLQVFAFAGGIGGISILTGPSAGYFFSSPIAAFVAGLLAERGLDRRFRTAIPAMVLPTLITFILGIAWQAHWYSTYYSYYYDHVFAMIILPDIIIALVQLVIVGLLLAAIWRLPFLKRRLNEQHSPTLR